MNVVAILLGIFLLAGCASGPKVHVQRDPATDFARYHTYAWKQEPPIQAPLLRQRVVAAIDAELAARRWRRVADTEADVWLVGNVSSMPDATLDYFHEGGCLGGDWRAPCFEGVERIELRVVQVGTLVLDVFDSATLRAVWRGLAQDYVPESQARRDHDALVAVHRMFRQFPVLNESSRR